MYSCTFIRLPHPPPADYFLTAVGFHPPWSSTVTTLQISQMFLGMGICASIFLFKHVLSVPCEVTSENFAAGLVMYASYAALFLQFAIARYLPGAGSGKPRGSKTASGRAHKAE
jgi:hypothetical protein